jgi:hypothetical protein
MKRALIVGIDEYESFNTLNGCINDVRALQPLLARNENNSPNFDCQIRTSDSGGTTRDELLTDVDFALRGGADVALIYFAGHGDPQGNDVALVTTDGTDQTPGIPLSSVLTKVQSAPVGEIIIILDCCFSGAAGGVPQLGVPDAALRSGVSILAASRGDQPATETCADRGLFSTFLCGGLEGGAADVVGKVTVAGLYSYLDESFGAWEQRPVFKTNVERLHILRQCQPAVPIDELRLMTTYFPQPDYDFPLDPSYEPDPNYPPRSEENERVFSTLQKYRAAKLLVPVGEDHLFFAAIKTKSCKLTPLGQHYWHLANQERL